MASMSVVFSHQYWYLIDNCFLPVTRSFYGYWGMKVASLQPLSCQNLLYTVSGTFQTKSQKMIELLVIDV